MVQNSKGIGAAVPGLLATLCLLSPSFFVQPAAARDKRAVVVDGVTRTFLVDPGKDAATTPSPMVFVFHGDGGSSSTAASLGFAKAWPEATVVYPQGLRGYDGTIVWQNPLGSFQNRDVRYVDAMLTDLSAAYRVDPRRVFATGISGGGHFMWVLLAGLPERFAAFAPVIGVDDGNLPWAALPRPVFYIHGDADPGDNPLDLAGWARDQLLSLSGCGTESVEWRPGVRLYQPSSAAGQPVAYWRFRGGHSWPNGATAAIVSFFQGQALPADPPAVAPAAAVSAGEIAAGTGEEGYGLTDGRLATTAQLVWPTDVALDPAGNLSITDDVERIRQVNRAGIISTVAGVGVPGFNEFNWEPRQGGRYFFDPKALTVDRSGNLYVADDLERRVVRIGADGSLRVVAGIVPAPNTDFQFSGDGGPADQAEISFPYGLAVDGEGNLYLSDTANNRVRRVTPDGLIRTVAGTGAPGYSGDGGPALQAQLHHPWGLALDGEGNLLIADTGNHAIRKLGRDGRITTVAGAGTAGFSGDGGPATAARLNFPGHIAVDSLGQLFIADAHNHRLRKVALDGTITTLVGEGGSADPAPLATPAGMAIDRSGTLYVADPIRYVVRKFAGVAAPGLVAGAPLP